MINRTRPLSVLTFAVLFLAGMAFAQTDPGVQSANRGTGATIITTDPNGFFSFFEDGKARFQEVEAVSGGANNGLGPRFNSNSCSSCHAQPALGGTGAAVNPQFAFAGSSVAPKDSTPYFITANGPTREARFPFFFNPNGTVNTSNPNGGVEDLFTVSGRGDAGSCSLQQPSFNAAEQANDIIFRIPTPTFGAGLIENLDDSTLLKNQATNLNNNFGVAGTFNHNGNDGTISRFGWKAQNKSLHIFTGEAYNVEMGITNELFTQDRPLPGEDGNGGSGLTGLPSNCLNLSGKGYPEDTSNPNSSPNAAVLDDVSAFANFMRFLAPPPTGGVVLNGQQVSSHDNRYRQCLVRLCRLRELPQSDARNDAGVEFRSCVEQCPGACVLGYRDPSHGQRLGRQRFAGRRRRRSVPYRSFVGAWTTNLPSPRWPHHGPECRHSGPPGQWQRGHYG